MTGDPGGPQVSPDVVWHAGSVDRAARSSVTGGVGMTLWFTGLSGSGKSSIAHEVERRLVTGGRAAYVLDGDNLRHGLNGDLGFAEADRDENVRRTAHVACLLADAGVVALVSLVSPHRAGRDAARALHDAAGIPFVEVFVDTPLDACRRRDPKGLYARSAAGELVGLTGVDAPYEAPLSPELHLDGAGDSVADLADTVLATVSSVT